ncbi:acylneuraminate cytidylyltransferase family protein [Ruthenibacterium sp. TH_2024_36131]|uniref:acylneuraminate cytidylyltransferase family protein n=1 Tax=Owariibacterium komagatae TaxID=3136601 RepID=UPI0038B25E25
MKTACFVPIKANSERVPGKNLRMLNGKKLYEYICEHIKKANVFDDVYIDTNSKEVAEYAIAMGFCVIDRKPELAQNTANGNDLLVYHYETHPEYDYYFQLFATAPYMRPETIRACYTHLVMSEEYDSCFTALENHSFYWFANTPINYRPDILPRSQDMPPVIEETTGLYGISKGSLERYRCRIGRKPYVHIVDKFEAVDINTEDDFKVAEYIGKVIYGIEEKKEGLNGVYNPQEVSMK